MTTRLKTVEYAFPTNTSNLSAATRYDFGAITLDIAETSSRIFKSAIIQVTMRSSAITAQSLTAYTIGVKLGSQPFNDFTTTETLTNTGDHASWILTRDAVSYFADGYFSSSSQTCQVGVQFTGPATINISAKLILTYQFDDTSETTRTKTVKIPIESPTSTLSNVLTELGTNQIPILTGGASPFLPEASISIKDIFFEIYANENHLSGTTDDQLGLQLDAEAETLFGSLEQALDTSCWMHTIWKRTDMDPTTVHAFRARGTTTGRFAYLYAVLNITYTYDHSSSTRILNSIESSFFKENGTFGGNTSTEQSLANLKFFIEEPGNITLAQSAVVCNYNIGNFATPNTLLKIGSGTFRSYAVSYLINSPASGYAFCQRFDGYGAISTPGLIPIRGLNNLSVGYYNDNISNITMAGMGVSLTGFINYYSDKSSFGADAHNHTIKQLIVPASKRAVMNGRTNVSAITPIMETNYYLNSVDYNIQYMHSSRSADLFIISPEVLSTEGDGEGYRDVGMWTQCANSSELIIWEINMNGTRLFGNNPGNVDSTRLNFTASRGYKVSTCSDGNNDNSGYYGVILSTTYHSIYFTISGSITDYSGTGAGITVKIYRSDNDEYIASTTTAIGGTFSLNWYDNTIPVYAQAIQDSTHKGRSQNEAAT